MMVHFALPCTRVVSGILKNKQRPFGPFPSYNGHRVHLILRMILRLLQLFAHYAARMSMKISARPRTLSKKKI